MKASVKKKWLKALRSGEYKQGKGRLRKKDRGTVRFCGLGVLVDVCGCEPRDVGEDQVLSERFCCSIGLDPDAQYDLVARNDSGMSFSEIADYIEANL